MKGYSDINEFPEIKDIENDGLEKLVVFDDFIEVSKKGMKKITDWVIASRKKKKLYNYINGTKFE